MYTLYICQFSLDTKVQYTVYKVRNNILHSPLYTVSFDIDCLRWLVSPWCTQPPVYSVHCPLYTLYKVTVYCSKCKLPTVYNVHSPTLQVAGKFMVEDDEEQMKEELKEAFRIYDKEVETYRIFIQFGFNLGKQVARIKLFLLAMAAPQLYTFGYLKVKSMGKKITF